MSTYKRLIFSLVIFMYCLPRTSFAETPISTSFDLFSIVSKKFLIPQVILQNGLTAPYNVTTSVKVGFLADEVTARCNMSITQTAINSFYEVTDSADCRKLWELNSPKTISILVTINQMVRDIQLIPDTSRDEEIIVDDENDMISRLQSAQAPMHYYIWEPSSVNDNMNGAWVDTGFDITRSTRVQLTPNAKRSFQLLGSDIKIIAVSQNRAQSVALLIFAKGRNDVEQKTFNENCGIDDRTNPINEKKNTICFDFTNGGVAYVPYKNIIHPNRSVILYIKRTLQQQVIIEVNGSIGFELGKILNQSIGNPNSSGSPGANSILSQTGRNVIVVEKRILAPRQSGTFKITAWLAQNGTKLANDSGNSVELIVPQTYFGAFRSGLSFVFGQAVDRAYDLRQVGNNAPKEVYATNGANVNFELTVGFALFPELFWGGRRYADGRYFNRNRINFAPIVGLGLVGTSGGSGSSVDFFKSGYFGLEWEFSPYFSIAAACVVRRVTRLEPGTQIGSPINASQVPTVTDHAIGPAIMINLSPEFMQFARKGGQP